MSVSFSLLIFPFILQSSHASLLCPYPTYTTPTTLKAANIYSNGNIYRISADDLTGAGFQRFRQGQVYVTTGDTSNCDAALCLQQLHTNQRSSDNNILHQYNFYFNQPPLGYTLVTTTTSMYCTVYQGDCGADKPIWRWTSDLSLYNPTRYAYSMDPADVFAGYSRDAFPICYGWAAATPDSTCGDGIAVDKLGDLKAYTNGASGAFSDTFTTTLDAASATTSIATQFTGYTLDSTLAKVATTASLAADAFVCNCLVTITQMLDDQSNLRKDHKIVVQDSDNNQLGENYATTGETFFCAQVEGGCGATLPLRRFFNIFTINTYYVTNKDTVAPIGSIDEGIVCYVWPTTYAVPAVCTALAAVTDGVITYRQAGVTTDYLVGTVATLTCASGKATTGNTELTCLSTAAWSPATAFGTCV